MTVKVVTDSGSDIPRDLAAALDISVVPLHVRFGKEEYKDGVDLEIDRFFEKLQHDSVHPTTSSPSPGEFAEVYEKLGDKCDGIISVHLSSKLSATYEAALKGRELVSIKDCPIEVVDSSLVTIPLALLAMGAAKEALGGKSLQEVRAHVHRLIPAFRSYGVLDTLKYIIKGGRLGKAGAALGSMLPVKPILTIKDGTITLAGMVRTRSKSIERLLELLGAVPNVVDVGISHSSPDDEIASFADRLKSFLPDIKPTIAKLGPGIGTHGGPGTILVALQQELGKVGADLEQEGRKTLGSLPSLQSIRDGLLQRKQKDVSQVIAGNPVPSLYL